MVNQQFGIQMNIVLATCMQVVLHAAAAIFGEEELR